MQRAFPSHHWKKWKKLHTWMLDAGRACGRSSHAKANTARNNLTALLQSICCCDLINCVFHKGLQRLGKSWRVYLWPEVLLSKHYGTVERQREQQFLVFFHPTQWWMNRSNVCISYYILCCCGSSIHSSMYSARCWHCAMRSKFPNFKIFLCSAVYLSLWPHQQQQALFKEPEWFNLTPSILTLDSITLNYIYKEENRNRIEGGISKPARGITASCDITVGFFGRVAWFQAWAEKWMKWSLWQAHMHCETSLFFSQCCIILSDSSSRWSLSKGNGMYRPILVLLLIKRSRIW